MGLAWSKAKGRVFAISGDGEINEGSVWEAAAGGFKASSLEPHPIARRTTLAKTS